jgi:hypothetical protein
MFFGRPVTVCGCVLFLASGATFLRGDVIQIGSPNQSYLQSTARIDFDQFSFAAISQSSDGNETFVYDSPLLIGRVPDFWATWNSPPNAETSNPVVGWTEGRAELLIQLSTPEATLGFELEPDDLQAQSVSAYFFTRGGLIDEIDRSPSGAAGALLFAASSSNDPIAGVYVVDNDGDGFAIADQRYSGSFVGDAPEPNCLGLTLLGAASMLFVGLANVRQFYRYLNEFLTKRNARQAIISFRRGTLV